MKPKIIYIPEIHDPIKASPGFAKKELSDYKLDIQGLCQFACTYCSSNNGNYLRINREKFADLTEEQRGVRTYPSDDPALMFLWPDILERLQFQLARKRPDFGAGKTLVFSMLTDGFSPYLVTTGVTKAALRLLLERTRFRLRILTKNAIVGSPRWIQFFLQHPGRFVVGLSTGSLDDKWAQCVEIGTSLPSARLRALAQLQAAGVPTYGMLCPVFPDVLTDGALEHLVARINPLVVERLWAEPYNDRGNWQQVRAGYAVGSAGYEWLTATFGEGRTDRWSTYSATLYRRLREKAEREGWTHKMRYMLYEHDIGGQDAEIFQDLAGVLLQSATDDQGRSKNPHFAKYQLLIHGHQSVEVHA